MPLVVSTSGFFSILCSFLHKWIYSQKFSCFPFYSSDVINSPTRFARRGISQILNLQYWQIWCYSDHQINTRTMDYKLSKLAHRDQTDEFFKVFQSFRQKFWCCALRCLRLITCILQKFVWKYDIWHNFFTFVE